MSAVTAARRVAGGHRQFTAAAARSEEAGAGRHTQVKDRQAVVLDTAVVSLVGGGDADCYSMKEACRTNCLYIVLLGSRQLLVLGSSLYVLKQFIAGTFVLLAYFFVCFLLLVHQAGCFMLLLRFDQAPASLRFWPDSTNFEGI